MLRPSANSPFKPGRFAQIVDKTFSAVTCWYGRRLDRSLHYRAATGLFAITILGLVGFLYMHSNSELAPEEDQGIVFALTKTPQYGNIDYADYYGRNSTRPLPRFPRRICASF